MIPVELSASEVDECAALARLRMSESRRKDLNQATTLPRTEDQQFDHELVGACGEMAVAKAFGVTWVPTVNTFHKIPDVGRFEVRATRHTGGKLIVRNNDASDRIFYFVTGNPPLMTIRGWISGAEAKDDRYWANPDGHRWSWFVPQSALHTASIGNGVTNTVGNKTGDTCGACGARLRQLRTEGGQPALLDYEPHPEGTHVPSKHLDAQGRPLVRVLTGDELPAQEPAWRSHRVTCPARPGRPRKDPLCRACRAPLDAILAVREPYDTHPCCDTVTGAQRVRQALAAAQQEALL